MSLLRSTFMCLVGCLVLMACNKKEEEPLVSGRFTEHRTCAISAPPTTIGLDTFYTQYINCSGIAVVAPAGVADTALYRADSIIAFLLDGLDPVRDELMRQGVYHILYPPGQNPNDMPERQGESMTYGPGSFLPHKQVSITSMANILCYAAPDNRSLLDCELVHEFGHSLHVLGLSKVYPDFDGELSAAYQNALTNGLWANTYSASDELHYFSEGMQIWYGVNKPGPAGGDGNSNHITTREHLRTFDPTLYNLLSQYLNQGARPPVCF